MSFSKLLRKLVAGTAAAEPVSFTTGPDRYRHWKLEVTGERAQLVFKTDLNAPLRPTYPMKPQTYDLGVDIELADAIDRIRFEHPQVKVVVITSGHDSIFSSGANIYMLRSSPHGFKIDFCKFTNETRLAMEEASAHSGIKFIAALNGTTAGGGYELAMACDEIVLVDDSSSVVSLPEVGLLGVLPGTGGLTRLVDKRKVRRDRADVFTMMGTTGIKGKRAVEWRLVDAIASRSKFADEVNRRAEALAKGVTLEKGENGISLEDITPIIDGNTLKYEHVSLSMDPVKRTAKLVIQGPKDAPPDSVEDALAAGSKFWSLRAFRELDNALLQLRVNYENIGVVTIETRGDRETLLAWDNFLHTHRHHWFVRETLQKMGQVLRRMDLTAKSFFAMVDAESNFTGSLLELALAADRVYMLDDEGAGTVQIQASELNRASFPTWAGASRYSFRFLDAPDQLEASLTRAIQKPQDSAGADAVRIPTEVGDEFDFPDVVRLAIEERASQSPDALTAAENCLRFPGGLTMAAKIFAQLSAWQNWVFRGTNAVGPRGALTAYGEVTPPHFDTRR